MITGKPKIIQMTAIKNFDREGLPVETILALSEDGRIWRFHGDPPSWWGEITPGSIPSYAHSEQR